MSAPKLVVVAALLSLGACGQPVSVRAPVLYPAALPVRAFPSIVVAGGDLPEGDLGERLTAHLAEDGQHTIKHVAVKELEPMHAAGAFSAYSLVVLVEPGLYDDASQSQLQQVQNCSFLAGCSTQYQNVYGSIPEVGGEVKVTIFEGPTAVPLQTFSVDALVQGANSPATRKKLVDLLGLKLERAVDVIESETRVELEQVRSHPIVRAAIAHIQKGEWSEGRSLLESAALGLGGLQHAVQARVWYDLAIARWYAPGPDGLSEQAYQAARRALELALKTDGTDRYQSALDSLGRARERARVLEEQRSAARHNYALTGAMPAPP